MIRAFAAAFTQLSDPAMRRFVWIGLGVAVLLFAVLWSGIWYLLESTALFGTWWLEWLADWLGVLVILILTWVLFPGLVSLVVSFILDGVAAAVEARHYPDLPPPPGLTIAAGLLVTLKYLAALAVLNLVILVFLLIPPLFPFVFYAVNGYLLGREYFELAALRRVGPEEARALGRAHRGQVVLAGATIAFLLTVPVVNLLAPIVATAAMVHLFHAWRGRGEG